jgi:ATP-binding cassette subfamily C protein
LNAFGPFGTGFVAKNAERWHKLRPRDPMPQLRKVLFLLLRKPGDARRAGGMLGAMLVAAMMEAVGIGAILPFIALLENPAAAQKYAALRWAREAFGLRTDLALLQACGVGIILVFLSKNVYLLLVQYLQARFIFGRQVTLAGQLMERYLRRPYTFHLEHNSAELVRNVSYETAQAFNHVIVALFTMCVELISVLVILALLVVLEPVVVPSVGAVLGVVSFVTYRFLGRRGRNLAKEQHEEFAKSLKWIQQGLGGVKEAKITGREPYFVAAYRRASTSFARAMVHLSMATVSPRYVLETVGIVGIVAICLVVLGRGDDARSIIPVLGVLAIASARLLPSASRILASMSELRHFAPSVETLYKDMTAPGDRDAAANGSSKQLSTSAIAFDRELTLEEVEYQYPTAAAPALRDVRLTIKKGESIGFVGSSGAGKTTLVDVVIGLLRPTRGRLVCDGVVLEGDALVAWQRSIGYVPQSVYLCDDSILRNVAFGIDDDAIDRERVDRAIEAAKLDDLVKSLPKGLDTFVGERGVRLSGGQRQRIGIARALYLDPKLFVFDEATSSLDGATEQEIVAAIESVRKDRTTIIVAHRLSTVRNCDRIVFMSEGRIVQVGTWEELLASNAGFKQMVELGSHANGTSASVA